jgi:hypothetical protein
MYDKILIGAPVHWVKAYSMPLWARAINALDFPKMAIEKVMIDTSEKKWDHPLLEGFFYKRIEIPQDTNKDMIHRRIAEASNILRRMTLEGGYSHLFMVECDVIVPTSSLKKMYEAKLPIIEGLYYQDFDFHPPEYWVEGDKIHECSPRGTMGVCLIERKVLEEVKFRYDPLLLKAMPDAFFHSDAFVKGFKSYVHCGVVCDHLQNSSGGRGWDKLGLKK